MRGFFLFLVLTTVITRGAGQCPACQFFTTQSYLEPLSPTSCFIFNLTTPPAGTTTANACGIVSPNPIGSTVSTTVTIGTVSLTDSGACETFVASAQSWTCDPSCLFEDGAVQVPEGRLPALRQPCTAFPCPVLSALNLCWPGSQQTTTTTKTTTTSTTTTTTTTASPTTTEAPTTTTTTTAPWTPPPRNPFCTTSCIIDAANVNFNFCAGRVPYVICMTNEEIAYYDANANRTYTTLVQLERSIGQPLTTECSQSIHQLVCALNFPECGPGLTPGDYSLCRTICDQYYCQCGAEHTSQCDRYSGSTTDNPKMCTGEAPLFSGPCVGGSAPTAATTTSTTKTTTTSSGMTRTATPTDISSTTTVPVNVTTDDTSAGSLITVGTTFLLIATMAAAAVM